MYNRAANAYRKVWADSAPPTRILDELYGAIIDDCHLAAAEIRAGNVAAKCRVIGRALAIVAELENALDHRAAPELTKNLAALYAFVRTQLFNANVNRDSAPLANVERIITPLREAFQQAARR